MDWKQSVLWKIQYQQIICGKNNFNRIQAFLIFTIVSFQIISLLKREAAAFNDLKFGLNAKDVWSQRSVVFCACGVIMCSPPLPSCCILSPQLPAWPWTNHLTTLCLHFPFSDGYNPTIYLLQNSTSPVCRALQMMYARYCGSIIKGPQWWLDKRRGVFQLCRILAHREKEDIQFLVMSLHIPPGWKPHLYWIFLLQGITQLY